MAPQHFRCNTFIPLTNPYKKFVFSTMYPDNLVNLVLLFVKWSWVVYAYVNNERHNDRSLDLLRLICYYFFSLIKWYGISLDFIKWTLILSLLFVIKSHNSFYRFSAILIFWRPGPATITIQDHMFFLLTKYWNN